MRANKGDVKISFYLVIGLVISAGFWIGDSLIDTHLFTEESLMVNLTGIEPIEAWMRIIVIAMILLVSYVFALLKKSKLIEDEFRRNESIFNEAQQVASIGSWERNIKTGELRWSDETFRLFGLEPGEINPTVDTFRDYIYPDDRNYVEEAIKKAVEDGRLYDIEFKLISKQGNIKKVHEKGRVFQDEDRGTALLRGTTQDITGLIR